MTTRSGGALLGRGVTSTPSLQVTPVTSFGNWFCPWRLRQVRDAALTSLNTISRAVCCASAPLVRTVRCRTPLRQFISFVAGVRHAPGPKDEYISDAGHKRSKSQNL